MNQLCTLCSPLVHGCTARKQQLWQGISAVVHPVHPYLFKVGKQRERTGGGSGSRGHGTHGKPPSRGFRGAQGAQCSKPIALEWKCCAQGWCTAGSCPSAGRQASSTCPITWTTDDLDHHHHQVHDLDRLRQPILCTPGTAAQRQRDQLGPAGPGGAASRPCSWAPTPDLPLAGQQAGETDRLPMGGAAGARRPGARVQRWLSPLAAELI